MQDLSALRTPHGGIRTAKKTKQQKKEDMHNKKRSRKVLNKQLMSMDFGLMAPPESESSDDDMFTGITSKRCFLDNRHRHALYFNHVYSVKVAYNMSKSCFS